MSEGKSVNAPAENVVVASGLSSLVYREVVTSTMDVAHELAEAGAMAGTAVLASMQTRGRGRAGRNWLSDPDAGLWLTLIERPEDEKALEVLSLRIGLVLADALTPMVDGAIGVKWPNDLFGPTGKLSGILVEARWREGRPEWVAIGIGINRKLPPGYAASSVRGDVSRDELLVAVVRAVRYAASVAGPLTEAECALWASRDIARGRSVLAPATGVVEGISPNGAVLIRADDGSLQMIQSGSLRFRDEHQPLLR